MLQLLKLDIEDVENENVVKSVKKVLNNMNTANRSEITKLRGADKKFQFLWDLVQKDTADYAGAQKCNQLNIKIENGFYFVGSPATAAYSRQTLLYFMSHLEQVSRFKDDNRMGISQLAMMVGPILSWGDKLPYNDMDLIIKQNQVFQFLITNINCLQQ